MSTKFVNYLIQSRRSRGVSVAQRAQEFAAHWEHNCSQAHSPALKFKEKNKNTVCDLQLHSAPLKGLFRFIFFFFSIRVCFLVIQMLADFVKLEFGDTAILGVKLAAGAVG